MWLGLQTVSSLERCPSFTASFIERFHCIKVGTDLPVFPHATQKLLPALKTLDLSHNCLCGDTDGLKVGLR